MRNVHKLGSNRLVATHWLNRVLAGLLVASFGAFFGMSFSPIAYFGWALSLIALAIMGMALTGFRRDSGRSVWLAWPQAVGLVVLANVTVWGVWVGSGLLFETYSFWD